MSQGSENVWESNIEGDILGKIKQCGERLDVWGREVTGSFSKRIKECKVQLKHL